MRRSFLLGTAALAGALALGCGEPQSPTPTASSPPSPASPTFVRSGNSSGGAVISRGTLATAFLITDEARGLTTTIGLTFEDLALLCVGGETLPEIAALFVEKPTGAVKLLLKDQALPVLVWQFVSDDVCGVLATNEPYAEGTARLRLTDNDVSDFPVGPGGNSSFLRAHGTVTVVETGEELHYQAIFHNTFPRGATSFDDIRVVRSGIRLY
jgi:hypothetical protein